jgi:eukaryotic-like serine/threonine-protein kinase
MMTPERYQRICQLFDEALECPLEQRAAFLDEACGADLALRAEVEKFLAGMEPAADYLSRPAVNVAAALLAQQSQNPSALGKQISHYQIVSLLGAGGMGRVYLARDARLGRQVALKLLPTQYTQDAERVSRFRTEAQAASALNHPNILTIYDVGEDASTYFIATEFVEGQTLRQRLLTGRLTLSETLDITMQIASALEAAHRAGSVHRDVKPENIMVRPDGLVKVLDFGLAKLLEKDEGGGMKDEKNKPHPSSLIPHYSTMPGKVMGTISYMSPEQALGQAVDARTDLFSLGVVLYEMLTGTPPFIGNSDAAVYDAILHQSPAPLRQALPQLPAEMEWILNRALEKDCEVRYQTASDLKAALLTIKRNSGSGAAAVSQASITPLSVPSDRQARRAKAAAAISLLVVLALVGTWLWRNRNTTKSASARQPVSFTRLTTQAGQELYPSLSPDGKQLVYASNEVGNLDIWLQRVGGKTAINLTRDSAADDTEPAFSPDGEQIVFHSEREGGGLFLMGATGESVRRLTQDGHNPAWSPDGKEIAYAIGFFSGGPNNRTTVPSALHAINVQTGATRLITKGDAVQPHWSPALRTGAFIVVVSAISGQ